MAESKLARARAYVDAALALEPRQIAYRPRRALPPRVLAAGLRDAEPPGWRPLAAGTGVVSAPQSGPTEPPHLSGTFTAGGLVCSAGDRRAWRSTRHDELFFSFALHSFDELPLYLAGGPDRDGDAFWTTVLGDWLRDWSRPAPPGWHPYPLSRRVVAWSAALSAGMRDPALAAAMRRSLTRQVRYLRRCVEHDIGGNHVLDNAVGLVVGGLCLGLKGPLEHGRRVMLRELSRQLLDDGGHCERSPSYHRHVLDRLRDAQTVVSRAGSSLPELDRAVDEMDAWLARMAGPDGRLPLLNDAWEGPPVEPASEEPVTRLASSGYVALRAGSDQAVLDVGPLCPPHLPPHAHADALSFVLWADGRPVVVDPGSGTYQGPRRRWARATASHNTVEIDGEDQCVFLGDFRAGRLPNVTLERIDHRDGAVIVVARHDGYRRLPTPVEHRRTFCWLPGDGLVVVDALRGRGRHDARSRLNLGEAADGPPTHVRVKPLFGARAERRAGLVAPYLGTFSPGTVVEQASDTADRPVQGWSLLRSEADVRQDGDEIAVHRAGMDPVRFLLG